MVPGAEGLAVGPGRSAPRERRRASSGTRVLLTTEGTYPHYLGGVSTWCDFLVREVPDVEFVVWALMMNPFISQQFEFPESVVQFVGVPLWGIEQPAEYTKELPAARVFQSARRTRERDVRREFVPLFEEFLRVVADPLFEPTRFAATLVAMRDYFRVWEYRATWRSPSVWEAFCQFLVTPEIAGPPPGIDEDENTPVPRWPGIRDNVDFLVRGRFDEDIVPPELAGHEEEVPTVAEATEGLRILYRLLQTLNVDVPDADVTHSAAAAFCAIPCILSKSELGTPFLLTEHGVYLREQYLAIARRRTPYNLKRMLIDLISAVSQTAYALADQVSPVCRFNGRWETAYGVTPDRLHVIYNGVRHEVFKPLDVDRPANPTVVQLARIDPLKDQVTFLRTAALVREEVPDVRFLHYGPVADDAYGREVQALYEELRLEGTVTFMGATSEPAVAMNQGDVVFLSSISEAFPYAVVEALMCAKPVVSTAVGGVGEALDGFGGMAPPRDVAGLARELVRLLRLPRADLEELGRRARERALSEFTLSTFVANYHRSYMQLAEAGRDRAPTGGRSFEPADFLEPVPAGEPVGALPRPTSELVARLADPDPDVRADAVSGVGGYETAEDLLLGEVQSEGPERRVLAATALGLLGGSRAAQALARLAVEDGVPEVRQAAVAGLLPAVAAAGRTEGP